MILQQVLNNIYDKFDVYHDNHTHCFLGGHRFTHKTYRLASDEQMDRCLFEHTVSSQLQEILDQVGDGGKVIFRVEPTMKFTHKDGALYPIGCFRMRLSTDNAYLEALLDKWALAAEGAEPRFLTT